MAGAQGAAAEAQLMPNVWSHDQDSHGDTWMRSHRERIVFRSAGDNMQQMEPRRPFGAHLTGCGLITC